VLLQQLGRADRAAAALVEDDDSNNNFWIGAACCCPNQLVAARIQARKAKDAELTFTKLLL